MNNLMAEKKLYFWINSITFLQMHPVWISDNRESATSWAFLSRLYFVQFSLYMEINIISLRASTYLFKFYLLCSHGKKIRSLFPKDIYSNIEVLFLLCCLWWKYPHFFNHWLYNMVMDLSPSCSLCSELCVSYMPLSETPS